MSLRPAKVSKGTVGANSSLPATSGSALLSNAPAIAGTLLVNTVYVVQSLKEVEALGITADYDITNDVVLHQHFKEFYKSFDNYIGPKVWLMVTDAATPAAALTDTNATMAKKLLITGDGNIWQLAIAWNVAAGDDETITDGFSNDLRASIGPAQTLAAWAYDTCRPCRILIEGRSCSSTLSSLIDLHNILVTGVLLEAPNVAVVIAQDWDYAEERLNNEGAPDGSKVHLYASVGKALGTVSLCDINQSMAEIISFNLSDAKTGEFVNVGLSNHLKVKDQEAGLQSVDDKGYIFAFYPPKANAGGARWNGDYTCVPIIIDDAGNINEHTIYYGRTIDYAAMQLTGYLTNLVKTRAQADASTGKLPTSVIRNLEKSADNDVFGKLAGAGLITEGKTTLDADSDLVTPPKSLGATFRIVPTIILDNFDAKVFLVKSISI